MIAKSFSAFCILLCWSDQVWGDQEDLLRRLTAIMSESPNSNASHRETALVRLLKEAENQGADNTVTAAMLNSLGTVYDALGRYAEAEDHYLRSIAAWRKADRPDELQAVQPICNLAAMYLENVMVGKAERLGIRSIASRLLKQYPQEPLTAALHLILGHIEVAAGRIHDAETAWLHALSIYERVKPDSRPLLAVICNLTQIYSRSNRSSDAQAVGRRGLAIAGRLISGGEAHSLSLYLLCGALQTGVGDLKAAEAAYRMALSLAESTLGPAHPDTGRCMLLYAGVLRKCKRKSEASALRARAVAILDGSYFGELRRHTVDVGDLSPQR
ncbi:MAG: tetratricopeptide repeat protein [Bryobacteraceae bacterium]|nr:tetratricopeptide repeat protein [Bryobacteraceae bacterium]